MRPYIIAIDFDGTITKNKNLGGELELVPEAKDFLTKLRDLESFYIIIWTCRCNKEHLVEMYQFLRINEIPFDNINKNYPALPYQPKPKIYADLYIDDRGVLGTIDWDMLFWRVKIEANEIRGSE